MTKRLVAVVIGVGVALATLGPLAIVGAGRSADRARQETRDWAESNIDQAFLTFRTEEVGPPPNTWVVNVENEWIDPLGETWTNPPLLALAQSAGDGSMERAYEFEGPWFAAGQWIGVENVIVTVVPRDDEVREIRNARLGWASVPILGALVAAGLGWWLAGRARTPVDRAHAVNRDFIADAAHELRTPLSIIQASAGHALSRDRSADEYRESLTEILDATERAGSSVGELLEFARLEAGQATPRLAPLRLDLLVEEVAAAVRVEGVVIEAEPTSPVVVAADYNLVRQMLDNLTRNAAARADKVTLSTEVESSGARVEIVDDGPGFDPGIIDHVFERFRRGDQSGSVGLGMAISRTIAELHGGSCEAANSPDGGAVVTVHLPYGEV